MADYSFRSTSVLFLFLLGAGAAICFSPAGAAEFSPYELRPLELSKAGYFTNRGAPALKVERNCVERGDEKVCRPEVRDETGRRLEQFPPDNRLAELAYARYSETAYMLLRRSFDCGEDRCRETLLFSHTGSRERATGGWQTRLSVDLQVTSAGNILELHEDGLIEWTPGGKLVREIKISRGHEYERLIREGRIENDLSGRQAAVVLAKSSPTAGLNEVWVSGGEDWKKVDLSLAPHGDRRNILSVYPHPDGGAVAGIYRYVNVFNKGLYLVRSSSENPEGKSVPVFLSTDRNVGWNPEVFISGDAYRVSALDSTNEQKIQITVPKEVFTSVSVPLPSGEKFPPGEDLVSLFAGRGFMRRSWRAESKVEAGGKTRTKVDYNFDPVTMENRIFQGRVGNTRLVLNYFKQLSREEASAEGGHLVRETADYLLGSVEFENFFSNSSGLRLDYRQQKTEGLAEVTRKSAPDTYSEFAVKYSQYGLYRTKERGMFAGLEYTDYKLPSAVGFRDSDGDVVYSDFDPDFGFRKLNFVAGYDPRLYARRYETDYSEWYVGGRAGFGLGKASLSSEVKREAKKAAGKDSINYPLFLSFDSQLETGYIYQFRSLATWGLGVQLLSGYRVEGSWTWAGSDEGASGKDNLGLEFDREDFWYGPYFNINVVF